MTTHLSALCERAIELHRQGHLRLAGQAYDELLRVDPNHFVALHLSGLTAAQLGDPREAVKRIGRAIEISPLVPSAHCNLAIAQQQSHDLEAALVSVTRAITLDPSYVVAYLNRASILIELGRREAALQDYDRAIAIDGNLADAWYGRGCVQHDLGDLQGALSSLQRAIDLNPKHGQAHHRCANVLRDRGEPDRALHGYELARMAGLQSTALYMDHGALLSKEGDLKAALQAFDQAALIEPTCAAAHYNRGVMLASLGDLEAAIAAYGRALAIDDGLVQAHLNSGVALAELARPHAALAAFDRAIQSNPDLAEAHFGKALILLRLGDYRLGWPEYEWRWRKRAGSVHRETRDFAQPRWTGESIVGKSLLLYSEQGFGDTLQFCRYAALAAGRGARVLLEVPAELAPLLESLAGPSQILVRGQALPEFDFQCPLMSLPLVFQTTLDGIPGTVPYLRPDDTKVRDWRSRLGAADRFRVGLVWSGRAIRSVPGPQAEFNSRRDLPITALAVLADADADFFSLQTGPSARSQFSELSALWRGGRLVDVGESLHDFADTAALLSQLDLVITVDTATAHLAGALGKPVWILNRLDACWRWLLDRSDSPWYPTARIFRQTRRGSWNDVLAAVRDALRSAIENARGFGGATGP
jgi:tetratricopeptide (TPR) repeat protein